MQRRVKTTLVVVCLSITIFFASFPFSAPPSSGSLYSNLPLPGLLAFGVGILAVIYLFLSHHSRDATVVGYAFTSLAVLYGGFYFLPLATGHAFYGSYAYDQLVQGGIIRDGVMYGHIEELRYPATHLLGASISNTTGLSIKQLLPLLPLSFTLFFILALYFFASRFTDNRWVASATAAFALPLYFAEFQISTMPWFFALTLLPVILGLIVMPSLASRSRERLLIGLLLVALAVYHLFTAVIASFAILAFLVFSGEYRDPARLIEVTILALTTAAWQIYTESIRGPINMLAGVLLGRPDEDLGRPAVVEEAGSTGHSLRELLWEFIILEWGAVFTILGLGGVAILYIVYRRVIERESSLPAATYFSLNYMIGIAIAVGLLATGLLGGPIRANQYSILFAICLTGYLYANLRYSSRIQTPHVRTAASIVLGVLLISSLVITLGTAYAEKDVTSTATTTSSEWLLEHQNPDNEVYSNLPTNKFHEYRYGAQEGRELRRSGYALSNETLTIQLICPDRCLLSAVERPAYFTPNRYPEERAAPPSAHKIYDSEEVRIHFLE